jgi:hypothetical protein
MLSLPILDAGIGSRPCLLSISCDENLGETGAQLNLASHLRLLTT